MSLAIHQYDEHVDIDLSKLPNDALLKKFHDALELTIGGLKEAARIWTEMQRRPDIDVSTLRLVGPAVFLPAIEAGTVIPEVVFSLHGRPSLMKKVAALTPTEQKQLVVDHEAVEVVERNSDQNGEPWTYRMMTLAQLLIRSDLVKQVFGERCIRSRSEQIAYLTPKAKPYEPGKPVKQGGWTVDRGNGRVSFAGKTGPLNELIEALKKAGVTI